MEPEGVLVGPGRTLLLGVRVHQGGVQVHQQQLAVGVRAGLPGTSAGMGSGRAQAGQPVRVGRQPLHHPPGGRGRGDLAEQLGLRAQHPKIAQAVPAIGQHHGQIPQHPSLRVTAAPATPGPPAQRAGQPQPVGQLDQQPDTGMADDAVGVGANLNR